MLVIAVIAASLCSPLVARSARSALVIPIGHTTEETGWMTFCFRLRFNVASTYIVSDQAALVFDPGPPSVVLSQADGARSLGKARRLALYGNGYDTENSARSAGEEWRRWLTAALARCYIGAMFADRAEQPQLTEAGLAFFAEVSPEGDRPAGIVPDVSGLVVNTCGTSETPASAWEVEVGGVAIGKPVARLEEAVILARQQDIPNSPEREVAFDLYGAAFFLSNPEARFITLVMAVETLLDEPRNRPEESVRLVDDFVSRVRGNQELSESERNSLSESLRSLRKESIGWAGRRLAASLKPRTYGGDDPVKFFSECYKLRSALVHGALPRPDSIQLHTKAAQLEHFVGDLLSGPLAQQPLHH